jgi:MFS superfamily sulfate permease-like transporter
MWARLCLFFTFFDSRFEDLKGPDWPKIIYRDFSAGVITALTAIPMAMAFAIKMGLEPAQGIIAGAVACLVGRTFGGSKYQVYGPTAAFIPILGALLALYTPPSGDIAEAHGFLVLVSIVSGVILLLMGLFGLGEVVKKVPNSIVVGFTIGIGVYIVTTNLGDILGYSNKVKGDFLHEKIVSVWQLRHEFQWSALIFALATFSMTLTLLRISFYIPAPALAIALSTSLVVSGLYGSTLPQVRTMFGEVPTDFFRFTPPRLPPLTPLALWHIAYFATAIVFVSAVESLLCSSMADRLAHNKGTPFHPDKEFWGQGLVQIFTPLFNGFPCTGALARTATSIKAGAVTPLAGYFKAIMKLLMVYFLASYLGSIPMACIGGIMLWVALNMIKPSEISHVRAEGAFPFWLMIFTAVMVAATDFLIGVVSALLLFAVLNPFFGPKVSVSEDLEELAKVEAVEEEAHPKAYQ